MWRKAALKHVFFSAGQSECKVRNPSFCSHWMNASQGFKAANRGVPGC